MKRHEAFLIYASCGLLGFLLIGIFVDFWLGVAFGTYPLLFFLGAEIAIKIGKAGKR